MVNPGLLLDRIRDLRFQISLLDRPLLPLEKLAKLASKTDLERLPPGVETQPFPGTNQPFSWRKTHLVQKGLALTNELKGWQARAESGAPEIEVILEPSEFSKIVQVADAALRLIPSFPTNQEILDPLAAALETILLPLWDKICLWHQRAQSYFELIQLADTPFHSIDDGARSALAASIVRFSQQSGFLGLWLLPWERVPLTDRTPLVRAWMATLDAFAEGVWAMHKAAFDALKPHPAPIESPNPKENWFPLKTKGSPQGPWAFCQSTKPDPFGKCNHPFASEWIPVDHSIMGTLLVFGNPSSHPSFRALRWGRPSPMGNELATVTLGPKDHSLIRDLPLANLRQKIAQLSLGGNKS